MDNTWQAINITVDREPSEVVSQLLIDLGAQGVEITDSADYLNHEDQFGEVLPEITQTSDVTITAYFPDSQNMTEIIREARAQLDQLASYGFTNPSYQITTTRLAEDDWADNWKQFYMPTRISHNLTILPSWTEDYQASNNELVIKLDPGMAFGTGTHPTTKLSLWALEQVMRGGETVLDVGTGSGVLSIAASLLGAKVIYASDIDDVAVRVAKENIDLNNTPNIHLKASNLLQDSNQTAQVIVANILADVLILLVDDAFRLLDQEGYLIMSGIIDAKLALVTEKTLKAGFAIETHLQQGEWHCLVAKKTSDLSSVIGG